MKDQLHSPVLLKFGHPVRQALVVLAFSLITMTGGLLVSASGINIGAEFPWLTSAAYILLFAMFNAILSIATQNIELYFRQSFLAFGILIVSSWLMAYVFSGIAIGDAGSYKWIYFVLTFGYLALLSIGGLIKRISMVLQKEEEAMRAEEESNRANEKSTEGNS